MESYSSQGPLCYSSFLKKLVRLKPGKIREPLFIKPHKVPKLVGIVSSEESKLAVLNDNIMAAGQQLDGYEILTITSSNVRLSEIGTSTIITLTLE